MKNLEDIYNIDREDLETKDKKVVLKYSKIIKNHKNLNLRFNNDSNNNNLISINYKSIQKLFDYLENELPEEHILFLFEKIKPKKKKMKEDILSKKEYTIDTSTKEEEKEKEKEKEKEQEEENEEKKGFLTLEVENPVLKKFKTLTHQIMKKYYFVFSILCFIIAILFTIHLFKYLLSKEVS